MNAVDYILDGLEAELALERELGVRSIEIDRALLKPAGVPLDVHGCGGEGAPAPKTGESLGAGAPRPRNVATPPPLPTPPPPPFPPPSTSTSSLSLAFLHHRPLSAAGVEMMAKIIVALKLSEGAARVVVAPPRPKAKVNIVLGGLALKRWFPGVVGAPGQWLTTAEGETVYVTYSPEYILRFKTVTPAVKKIKVEMWQGIKSALKRIS